MPIKSVIRLFCVRLTPWVEAAAESPTIRQELEEILENGLRLSRVGQVLVERCIAGWKEIEYEVMRDGAGNVHHRLQHGKYRPGRRAYRRQYRCSSVPDSGRQRVPDAAYFCFEYHQRTEYHRRM